MKYTFLLTVVLTLSVLSGCFYDNGDDLGRLLPKECAPEAVSYETEIEPVLNTNCYACHTGPSPSGGVEMGGYNNTKALVESGQLIGVLQATGSFSLMPPNGALPDCQITTIEVWINEGAQQN